MIFGVSRSLEFSNGFLLTNNGHIPTRISRAPHFFSLERERLLAPVLERPYSVFIEVSPRDNMEALTEPLLADEPDLLLSITTKSCYRARVAQSVSDALNQRFGLQGHKTLHIETCLQEAILNAMLHGNFGLESQFSTLDNFTTHQSEIARRLTQDRFAHKRVHVRAWDGHHRLQLAVSDEGSGFSMEGELPEEGLLHGRGLFFIRSLADKAWVGDDRHTLYMSFSY